MSLLRALLFLRLTSLRNAVTNRVRRLKQPKYLVGALAGAAYFWFFFFRHLQGHGGAGFSPVLADPRVEIGAAIMLTFFGLMIWVVPGAQPGLSFSEAEVAFLFPAPLSRRQLIHYKLLDGLLSSLAGAALFTLLSGGLRYGWIGAFRHLGAWWVLNACLSLHQTAAALTIARLSRLGIGPVRRRLLVLALAALVGVVVGYLYLAGRTAPAEALLWPARLAVRPFLADSLGHYLVALLPALGLVVLHYFWVHAMETPFEEASLARAQRRGERLARRRAGRSAQLDHGPLQLRQPSFTLTERMPPEFGFLWKNLMVIPSYFNRWVLLGATVVLAGGITWLKHQTSFNGVNAAAIVGGIALLLLAYTLIIGPQLARNDLRGDLLNADILKTYPLPGWRIVLGQLLAPTAVLTGIAWLFLLTAALAIAPPADRLPWLTPGFRLSAGLSLAVLMPAVCTLQLLVPNTATLLFPAWAQLTRVSGGGGNMEMMGQRMIFFGGQLICLLLALVPAVIASGVTFFLTQWLVGPPAASLLAALPALGIFLLEIWLGIRWLGPKFEQLDISSELRP